MSCQEFVEFLTEYLEERLPADARERFEAHIVECQHCAIYIESFRTTIALAALCADREAESPPPRAPDQLVEAILAARESSAG